MRPLPSRPQLRLKAHRDDTLEHPTRPRGHLSQAWATATAIAREMSHPQLFIPIRGLRWASPPPLGRVLVLLAYWAMIIYFISWNVTIKDVYYWERIGFRNAWITMTQLPMLYLLAMKVNPVGFLIGSSHERLNWLHRWVARTMFVTATIHGFHFWTMWVQADYVEYSLQILPLVKYGLGAWAILLWLAFSGALPLRRLAYEVWVAQHVIASILILWLLYVHIPSNARYLLWMSISFLVLDRAARWALLAWRNVRFKPKEATCQGQKRIGHHVSLQAVGPSTTVVTVKDVHFSWQAGQHVYLWLPRVGLLEAHPYTIACAHRGATEPNVCCCNSIQLIVRAHDGFSKRLYAFASKNPTSPDLTGFLSGPYGAPPQWAAYETLVLIGASTGASFVVPILESLARTRGRSACVRRADVVLVAKTSEELTYYLERSRDAVRQARARGVDVRLHVATTGGGTPIEATAEEKSLPAVKCSCDCEPQKPVSDSDAIEDSAKEPKQEDQRGCCCSGSSDSIKNDTVLSSASQAPSEEQIYTSRPDLEPLIRDAVERAWGETAVVVCGGREITARARNCVSRLSDERAVHKGTGAQGIYLHVEEYAF